MVKITIFEIRFDEGTFSASLPFGTTEGPAAEAEADEEGSSGAGKGLAILGVLVFLVLATALIKYLSSGDEKPEVTVDAGEEPEAALDFDEE